MYMNKVLLLLLVQFIVVSFFAQTDQEKAFEKAKEAIKMMDAGQIDESIQLLRECEKMDPENYQYPYEIAYAHVLKEEYDKAAKILKKVKKYKFINSQVYQMLGNCYSLMGKPEVAIKEYEMGMKVFPNSGNLHLEKGNIYLGQGKYDEAVVNYENGIAVDPTFTSNYYRLAKLFLNSRDKLSGLIYGEIFMNLERTTTRTQEMSELLYDAYHSSITLGDTMRVTFCKVIIDAATIVSGEEFRLPLCAVFENNFILALLGEQTLDLNSLASIRKKFIENYFKKDAEEYPNVLFQFHKQMLDNGVFDAYNYYLFQIGNQEEFNQWKESHQKEFEEFVVWYIQEENSLKITNDTKFIRSR